MRSILTCLLGAAAGFLILLGLSQIGAFDFTDRLAAQWFRATDAAETIPVEGRLFISLLLGVAIAWVCTDVPHTGRRWAVVLVLVLLLFTGSLVLSLYGILFPPAMPVAGVLLTALATMALCRVGPGAHRRKMESVFGRRVSTRTLRTLCEGRASKLPEAASRTASVLVLESTNHADLIRNLPAEDFAALSRFYLTGAADYLVERGGFLLEASGKSLKVVFGAPLESSHPGASAGAALLGLLQRLENLNVQADARWHHLMEFRAGVATGEVIGGFFGNPRTTGYTVSGPPLDLAERLAAACSEYGCRDLVCPATFEASREETECRAVDLIRDPQGRQLEVYELLCLKGALSPERERSRDLFWKGIIYYREKKWREAAAAFTDARIKGIPDPVLDFYLQRVESHDAAPKREPAAV